MPLTQVPPALLTSTTGTGSTVVLGTSPTITSPTISGQLNNPLHGQQAQDLLVLLQELKVIIQRQLK
jgi:hypothetical protein